jgi:large subunit ribosomal protein L24
MKKEWSKNWKSSKRPNKQRKYRYNAPLHIKQKFLGAHLSPELRTKYKTRSAELRKGDRVKIMRGQFKKKMGKITKINIKKEKVYVEGIENIRKDGNKVFVPLRPSNLMITELNLDDKKRKKWIERKEKNG